MEERKSMGSALVDVFDAGVVLVKSEINGVTKKVGEIAKAKGIGVVLLLAAVGPLVMGLIFLILSVFYALMRFFGWHPWAAALAIAVLSFAVTVGLVLFGISKLGAQVDTEMPRRPVPIGPVPTGSSAAVPVPATAAAPVGAAIAAGNTASHPSHTDGAYLKDVRYTTDDLLGDVLGDPKANRTVYESQPSGEAPLYGSGLNKRLDDHDRDPLLQGPVVIQDGPGISVSTNPTFREDMKKEGY